MMRSIARSMMLAGLVSLVSACGGGSDVVTSPLSFPLKTAYTRNFLEAKTQPYTLSGTLSGATVTGSGTYTQSAVAIATFEGQPAYRKVTTVAGTIIVGGVSEPFASTTTSFVDASYNPLGSSDSEYEVLSGTASIPASAKVGDAAIAYTTHRYASSSKAALVGTSVYSYALEASTATTAKLKFIKVATNQADGAVTTTTTVFEMTADGVLTRVSESTQSGSGTLEARY